jgi:FtsP/CotA-like multicopper oxidase with cupredoxin domain
MYMNGTNWMDGTVGVTQCAIAPGTKFTYEFNITGQSGTYFYHGHHGVQSSDGLTGPLIVHSKNERTQQEIKYASDRVILVQDHYYDLASELLMRYLEPDRENIEPVPASALINGRNSRNCDALPNRKCDNSSASIPIFALEPNKNHRLRFVNVGSFAEFQIQVDSHSFAVTEVDGTDVQPEYAHRLNINPAQRYSILLHTNVTDHDEFYLRARMITHCFGEPNPELDEHVKAIIQYATNPIVPPVEPSTKDWDEQIELECRDLNVTRLKPVIPIAAPSVADNIIYLRSNFEIGAWKLSRGFFNTSSWKMNATSPSLGRFVSSAKDNPTVAISDTPYGLNNKLFEPKDELVYQTVGIQTIDILISNFDDGNHPMHLHGYKFFVLAAGHGYPPEDLHSTLDLSNPLRRDTASVEAFGWLLLRVVFDNPGMWAFHCHVNWHAEAGLLMQFIARADKVALWEMPQANWDLCKRNGVTLGERPSDNIWYGHGLEDG